MIVQKQFGVFLLLVRPHRKAPRIVHFDFHLISLTPGNVNSVYVNKPKISRLKCSCFLVTSEAEVTWIGLPLQLNTM